MASVAAFVLTAIVIYFTIIFFKRKSRKNILPGPWGLPLFGNVMQLGAFPHLKLMEWVQVYGKIFQINFFRNPVVVISDPKMIREAYNDPRMSGRMDHEPFYIFADGPHGIGNSEGEEWAEQRRFAIKTLRGLGFGKKSMEGIITNEVNDFMAYLKDNQGQSLRPDRRLNICILNMLWGTLSAGFRVKQDDTKFLELFDRQKALFGNMTKTFSFWEPSIAKMFPNLTSWNAMLKLANTNREIFMERIKEHEDTFDENIEPRDFIDAYLREIKNTQNPESSFYKDRGYKSLTAVMSDFFMAGPDTTSSTLAWAILYLTKFPHVQKKFYTELDEVVGNQRHPTIADRSNLPYVCATIEEVFRFSSIMPIGVFRRALEDISFQEFHIPKGTWICHNHYYMQMAKEIWGNPEHFEPERHLSADEKTLKIRHEANLPFGIGKRVCVGESLSRDAIFLFLVNIFQKYQVKLSPESANVSFNPVPRLILHPPEYKVVMEGRT